MLHRTFCLARTSGGGIVKELKEVDIKLVSASQLAEKYNMSTTTIRDRLVSINQGTKGKALYNPRLARDLLTTKKQKRQTESSLALTVVKHFY